MSWCSKEAEQHLYEAIETLRIIDKKLEEQRAYGGYTGPVGPTIFFSEKSPVPPGPTGLKGEYSATKPQKQ